MRPKAAQRSTLHGNLVLFTDRRAANCHLFRQHRTNVSSVYSRSFSPEIRYFFLTYTKYACEKLPFSDEKSLAESSPPIYVVLPEL